MCESPVFSNKRYAFPNKRTSGCGFPAGLKRFFREKFTPFSSENIRFCPVNGTTPQNDYFCKKFFCPLKSVKKGSQKFTKPERLSSKKLIDRLFKEGNSFFKYPFKVVFLEVDKENTAPVAVLISISKKRFKKATERNRIKRIVREAFRKNKALLYESEMLKNDKSLLIGLIYTGKTILPYSEVEKKIVLILRHFLHDGEKETGLQEKKDNPPV